MTPGHQSDGIDFKPFFDMIVGVLFILLILIAAQMFFSSWSRQLSQTEAEQQALELRWLEEQQRFLTSLADDLRRGGLPATVSPRELTVVVDLPSQGAGAAGARIGRSLQRRMSCIDGTLPRDPGCERFDLLRTGIAALTFSGPAGSAEASHRLTAITLAAALFENAPDLLALRSPAGAPAFATDIALTQPSAAVPRLQMRFRFSGRPSAPDAGGASR